MNRNRRLWKCSWILESRTFGKLEGGCCAEMSKHEGQGYSSLPRTGEEKSCVDCADANVRCVYNSSSSSMMKLGISLGGW